MFIKIFSAMAPLAYSIIFTFPVNLLPVHTEQKHFDLQKASAVFFVDISACQHFTNFNLSRLLILCKFKYILLFICILVEWCFPNCSIDVVLALVLTGTIPGYIEEVNFMILDRTVLNALVNFF